MPKCKYCGRVFETKAGVNIHISNIHPDKVHKASEARKEFK